MAESTKTETPKTVMNPPADPFTDKAFCKEMARRCTNIQKEMGKIESSFEKIAFDLHYIYTKKGYEVLGYKNIYELAKDKFNIARGTAHGFISIVDRFAKRDDSGAVLPEIDPKYKGFKSSQLSLMCSMDDKQLDLVKDSMSVRDMKKLLKSSEDSENDSESDSGNDSEKDPKNNASPDAPSGESKETVSPEGSSPAPGITMQEKTVPTRQTLIAFATKEDYEKNIDNLDTIIMRALTPKKGNAPKYKVEVSIIWDPAPAGTP